MTFKETIKVNFQPYEYAILDKAYQFASETMDEDMPEELYELLNELQDVTNRLMMMDERYGH